MKFTEEQLEKAVIRLLQEQGFSYVRGDELNRNNSDVLIKDDLRSYLLHKYASFNITDNEIESIVRKLEVLPASDLYQSNKQLCSWLADGFVLKREDRKLKDIHISLIDYYNLSSALEQLFKPIQDFTQAKVATSSPHAFDTNIYKIVNQLNIEGADGETRIPDLILYINGLPLVVFEFKSAIREEQATIFNAFEQLTVRYRRAIPQLFIYNAFCVISDGVNNKMGGLFSPYEFFYAWRKITGNESVEKDGINALHTMLQGLFDKNRLRDVVRNFVFFPDTSKKEIKIVCRYPQYYAARKLFANIKLHRKPEGDGKGGTYFGATGCGKSYTMQFLTRLLMKSVEFGSPTIVLITDRTDLDDQLSQQFSNAKLYIGDQIIETVESRDDLRAKLKGRNSGGIFLTTIHKFTEDTKLLSERSNIICISDEAHRSQVNLDQKVKVDFKKGTVTKSYGFAKHLHESLPNATYVGFTGTPIDATYQVFGEMVDSYTMTESVKDEITVRIVYEGRAAKVILDNAMLAKIEEYYKQCAEQGSNEHQIEESKKASANMSAILGNEDRIKLLALDFVQHYENRVSEGASVKGKAMFVSSSREIAYDFYNAVKNIRPDWFTVKQAENINQFKPQDRENAIKAGTLAKPIEQVKLVMTRGQDDCKALWDLLGDKAYRKDLDTQFKNPASNFKIAIVVDMWLTGFDVPFLDTIYIDKPIQQHNLIQTISRVNRKFEGKNKGLVVDYIGIKDQMNKALAQYSKGDSTNFEDIEQSLIVVKDYLDLLNQMFSPFDASAYYSGDPVAQLSCLNWAGEFVLQNKKFERRFMELVKRLKAAYDVCCGSEELTQTQKDTIHFYLAVRSIVYKLTKGDAPDTAQMNAKVREMIADALQADGIEEIMQLGEREEGIDIFDGDYLAKLEKVKLPNTKAELLQKLLAKAIGDFKKVNRAKAINFTKRFTALVDLYNQRKEDEIFESNVHEDFSTEVFKLIDELKAEMSSFADMGINFEEKAFYDILKTLAEKYEFEYPEDSLLTLAKEVKTVVDDKAKYTDWSDRIDIKAELRADLIVLLAKHGYPPIDRNEVYKEIFEQAENFKKHRVS
ncbi:type I restriction endonuclease subunit R [Catenovulum agarivorans]|uniref:type I restriction endonuclease subunit R n=1 Tax=Catenovulum agarivorans TaxID=1172192 RepID=UPI0002E9C222|nr:HsdR family type I site-specific deoxyribonuclease [Catenovulum agarivorans]